MDTRLLIFLAGILLTILASQLLNGCGQTTSDLPVPIKVTTRVTDTFYINKTDTFRVAIYLPKLVYVDRLRVDTFLLSLPKDSLIALLAHRTYADTVTLTKGLKVHYRAHTMGKLDSLSLGVVDTRPTMVIKDSVNTTITLPPKHRSLGVGVLAGKAGIAPGLQYGFGKHQLGAYYNLLPSPSPEQALTLTYQYKLLSW